MCHHLRVFSAADRFEVALQFDFEPCQQHMQVKIACKHSLNHRVPNFFAPVYISDFSVFKSWRKACLRSSLRSPLPETNSSI